MAEEIPLTNNASSVFDVELNGRTITLRTKFNTRGSGGDSTLPYWTLDLFEGDTPLAYGLSLVLGLDILKQLNLGLGAMFMFDRTETSKEATFDSLGADTILVYLTPEEVENAATV